MLSIEKNTIIQVKNDGYGLSCYLFEFNL
jgi:hypothetical protein